MEKVIIAVDAGGTKTKVVAINEKKEIVYEVVGGPGSPAVLKEQAFSNIFSLVLDVYNHVKDKYQVTMVQMGVSGIGVVSNISSLEQQFEEQIKVESPLASDAILALYSIIEDKSDEGVLVLAGTGSVVVGIKNGKIMLKGGFGQLLTEFGSSYAAVHTLVCDTINYYEDTLTYKPLGKKFMDLLSISSIDGFKVFMYTNTKTEIAKYAKFISEEAINGDIDAINILKNCGRDLALAVVKLYKHLELSENALVGFRGSFVQKAAYVKEELMKVLAENNIHPRITDGEDDPIYGAYYMAKKKGKI